mgnify:CR=1 FL=1
MHKLKILSVALLLVSLAITPAYAKRNGCGNQCEQGGERIGKIAQLTEKLGLSPQQETDIKEIIAASKEKKELMRQEKKNTRNELREISSADTLDESRLRELVREQAEQQADTMVAMHATRAMVNQILTPQQQEQHEELRQQRQQRSESRRCLEDTER